MGLRITSKVVGQTIVTTATDGTHTHRLNFLGNLAAVLSRSPEKLNKRIEDNFFWWRKAEYGF